MYLTKYILHLDIPLGKYAITNGKNALQHRPQLVPHFDVYLR
jgi:hypothetical protein